MHTKTASKSGTSAHSAGKKNTPSPMSVPVSARATRHRPASEKSPLGTSGTGGTPALSLPAATDRGIRTSVSLYERDLDELEPLRAFLREKTGLRAIADSSLVQTICRAHGKPGPEHVAAFRAVLEVTGRKYRRG